MSHEVDHNPHLLLKQVLITHVYKINTLTVNVSVVTVTLKYSQQGASFMNVPAAFLTKHHSEPSITLNSFKV